MSCLPIGRRLKRFGQVLRKMLPTSSKLSTWMKGRDEDKENLMTCYNSSSGFTSFAEDYPNLASIWVPNSSNSMSKLPQKNDFTSIPEFSYFGNHSDASNVGSPSSSGYGSFGAVEQSTKAAETLSFNTQNSIPYSPLSSFSQFDDFMSDIISDLNLEDLLSTPNFEERKKYDDIRLEFEMNGRTEPLNSSFSPSQCSTPITNRKGQQWTRPTDFTFRYKEFVPAKSSDMSCTSPKFNEARRNKKKPDKKSLLDYCVFCKNNGEPERKYRSHTTKNVSGKTICPMLRKYECPICRVTGDNAHTKKYCPNRPVITLEDTKRKNFKLI